MRCLRRNKREVHYALYEGKTALTDADGLETGEYRVSYSTPVKAYMNVSAAHGRSLQQMAGVQPKEFGNDVYYTHQLVTCDMKTPFDTETVFWLDAPTDKPHDHKVVKVSKSINSVTLSLSRVDIQ